MTLRLENTYLRLSTRAAAQQIEPRTVGTVENGPRQVYAIFVEDVDAVCQELTAKGIPLLNGPQDRPWGMRTASIQDPDGNVWALGSDLEEPSS